MKQYYDEEGVETKVGQVYYCFTCVQNLDSDLGGDTKVSIK